MKEELSGKAQELSDEARAALKELLRELLSLVKQHGQNSEEVRGFVRKHRGREGFEAHAVMLLFLEEELSKTKGAQEDLTETGFRRAPTK